MDIFLFLTKIAYTLGYFYLLLVVVNLILVKDKIWQCGILRVALLFACIN